MRLSKHRRQTRPEMDMTPMIDIVFLLLIFFMTVSQVSEINKEKLELAQLKGSQDQDTATITINVMEDGEYRIGGNPVSLAQVVSLVGAELDRVNGDSTRLNVVVRADQRGLSQHTNQVLNALARLGIVRINAGVESPQ
jgi:biopolymer transport protein ExbD